MRGEFPWIPLHKLTTNFDRQRVPVKKHNRKTGPYPYYGASGVADYVDGYIFEGLHLLIAEDGENLKTRKTPIAFLASGKFWVNNHAHIVQGNELADTNFLHKAFQMINISQYLSGSTRPKLTQKDLNRILLPYPTLPEQKRIAAVLGALDDKIELNGKMNKTLEAMAQAIFKSWFVDFEPFRDGGMVDSELGPIPKGWEVDRLGEVADLNYGKSLPKTKLLTDGVPVYGAAGVMGYYSKAMFNKPVLLITCRGSFSGNIHETWEPAFVTNNSMTIVPFEHWMSRHYLREALLNSDCQSVVTGSAQPQITLAHLRTLKLLLPPPVVVENYTKVAEPGWQKIAANNRESHTLAELRDTLLPKLISGEIRVPETEKIVEEV